MWVKISDKSLINFSGLKSLYRRQANRKERILLQEKYFKSLNDLVISAVITYWATYNFSKWAKWWDGRNMSIWRCQTLREKCPKTQFFLSIFSLIRTEYGDLKSKFPYPVQIKGNKDHKKLRFGHFSRCER